MDIIGATVRHKKFGKGSITSFYSGKIEVSFEPDGKIAKFKYPDAFNSFLSFDDYKLQKHAIEQLRKRWVFQNRVKNPGPKPISKDNGQIRSEDFTPSRYELSFDSLVNTIETAYDHLSKTRKMSVEYPGDYWDSWNQACYIARYLYAYAFEYEQIYLKILASGVESNEIRVLSLGCGAMVDAWALEDALIKMKSSIKVDYTGVDVVKWDEKYTHVLMPSFSKGKWIYGKRAQDFLREAEELDYDVVFFPKSIGDIGVDADLLSSFKKIKKDVFFLAASMIPYNDKENRDDRILLREVARSIKKAGYEIEKHIEVTECDGSVYGAWDARKYPVQKEIIEEFTGRSPALRRTLENYIIVKFTKRGRR